MALIAHTADWHIGRSLLGCDRRADHRAVLAEVCEQIEQRRPDLVIHSGDVFDGLRPATEDLRPGDRDAAADRKGRTDDRADG